MPIHLLSAVRTPLGALGGALQPLEGVALGALVMREAVARAGAKPVREVIAGCAFQEGMGPNPAQRAARMAGLDAPAWTVNHLCGSGLMALIQAARCLVDGNEGFVVASSFESVSNTPYLLPAARWGHRMGETQLLDPLWQDGPPWFSRVEAPPSYNPPPIQASPASTQTHILPVSVPRRKGAVLFTQDEVEGCGCQAPPVDGAAALVLASAQVQGKPLARLLGHAITTSTDEARQGLSARAGLPEGQIQSIPAEGPLLAAGGLPLVVDTLHAKPHRFPFISLPTGDGRQLSLLLELL